MDQFLTKPAGAASAAAAADVPDGTMKRKAQPNQPKSVGASAVGADGTPQKRRRSSAGAGKIAPRALLLPDDSAVASSADDRSAAPTAAAAPAAPAAKELPPLSSEQERVLRDFDLRSRYGAVAGVDRLVRWERASRLGLQPPQAVKEILEEYAAVPDARRSVLDEHLFRYDQNQDSGVRC